MNRPAGTDIRFDGVTLERGDRRVFDALSLTLAERRIGLIGQNGAGKSSLLRLINGLVLPDSGTVRVAGHETREARRDLPGVVGFVFQNPDHQIIFPTVGEEIRFGLEEAGLDRAAADARAAEILGRYGCAGWEKRAVHELSEGQKQLVCLLAVIAPAPAILLFDEPFSSLDLRTRIALARHIAALDQQIVMASHDLDFLEDFDRVLWIENGRVRLDGPPATVIADYRAHARAAEPAL